MRDTVDVLRTYQRPTSTESECLRETLADLRADASLETSLGLIWALVSVTSGASFSSPAMVGPCNHFNSGRRVSRLVAIAWTPSHCEEGFP